MSYEMHTIKVLLVEDNQAMMMLTKSLLNSFGIVKILTAPSADKGYEIFRSTNPDLVITDWMLKPRDGIDLTTKIRADETSPNHFVPIIMMTGFSEAARVIGARDSGVTEFLVKPFNARDLYRRIAQVIEKPRQFVRSEDFFGPDRRRKKSMQYVGPERRFDEKEEVFI